MSLESCQSDKKYTFENNKKYIIKSNKKMDPDPINEGPGEGLETVTWQLSSDVAWIRGRTFCS